MKLKQYYYNIRIKQLKNKYNKLQLELIKAELKKLYKDQNKYDMLYEFIMAEMLYTKNKLLKYKRKLRCLKSTNL